MILAFHKNALLAFDLSGVLMLRLPFGIQSFVIISDPAIAKRLLKDNSKAYSKVRVQHMKSRLAFKAAVQWLSVNSSFYQGILAEILDFVMGKGLIPADEEVWRVRRRVIVPALHRKVFFSKHRLTTLEGGLYQAYFVHVKLGGHGLCFCIMNRNITLWACDCAVCCGNGWLIW